MSTEQTSKKVAKIAAKWTALQNIVRVKITVSNDGFEDWFEMPVRDFKAVMASALTQTQKSLQAHPGARREEGAETEVCMTSRSANGRYCKAKDWKLLHERLEYECARRIYPNPRPTWWQRVLNWWRG